MEKKIYELEAHDIGEFNFTINQQKKLNQIKVICLQFILIKIQG